MRFWPQMSEIVASHDPKVAGSNPAPAIYLKPRKLQGFCVCAITSGRKLLPDFCLALVVIDRRRRRNEAGTLLEFAGALDKTAC
jgi:hypothetical protein